MSLRTYVHWPGLVDSAASDNDHALRMTDRLSAIPVEKVSDNTKIGCSGYTTGWKFVVKLGCKYTPGCKLALISVT